MAQQSTSNANRLADLSHKRASLWNELVDRSGNKNPKEAIDAIEYRMTTRSMQIDGIETSLTKIEGSKEELQKTKKDLEQSWVFGLDDLVQEGGEEAAEKGAKKALEAAGKKGAGKALGWIALVGDVVEYGGKKIIKELNIDQLEEMIEQNRINLIEALKLQSALLRDNDEDRRLRDELKDLRHRYEQATHRYMMELQRQAALKKEAGRKQEPEKIVDFCSFIPDERARKACYGAWRKQCAGALDAKKMDRCYATLDTAAGASAPGGKLRNVCADMKPDYKQACYNFGQIVRRLCQMITSARERGECIRNVRRIPAKAAVERK